MYRISSISPKHDREHYIHVQAIGIVCLCVCLRDTFTSNGLSEMVFSGALLCYFVIVSKYVVFNRIRRDFNSNLICSFNYPNGVLMSSHSLIDVALSTSIASIVRLD